MKKSATRLLSAGAVCALFFTACGGSSGTQSAYDGAYYAENGAKEALTEDAYEDEYGYADDEYEVAEEYDYDGVDATENASAGSASDTDNTETTVDTKNGNKLADKLVYYGDVSIDTLDYDKSVKDFKALIEKQGGFVEGETYSDGDYSEYNYYYVSEDEKNKRYTATIRIPSNKYDTVMNALGDLGDVRSKTSSTENFSQEYSDLSIRLDILEQTYDRYSALMENATDEKYILELQSKMTELQIEIEQTKSRMNKIDTDVKYSYLNITIREVYKYSSSTPTKTSFSERLGETFSDTWVGFVDFLQELLFFIIRILPYVIILGVIALIVLYFVKRGRTKHPERNGKRNGQQGYMPPNLQNDGANGNAANGQADAPKAKYDANDISKYQK